MPKLQFQFDLAAILLASALIALGMSPAEAGGRVGGGGDIHSRNDCSGSAARMGEGAASAVISAAATGLLPPARGTSRPAGTAAGGIGRDFGRNTNAARAAERGAGHVQD